MSRRLPRPFGGFFERRYREMPVQRKLLFTVLAASSVSVLFAGLVLFAIQIRTLHQDFRENFLTLAGVVADQAVAPLAANDSEALQQVLQAFRAKVGINRAVIVLPSGRVAARFGYFDSDFGPTPTDSDKAAIVSSGWKMHVTQAIVLQGSMIARLQVDASFRPIFVSALKIFLPSLFLVTLLAVSIAVTLTLTISALFVGDLQKLTHTAFQIAETNDFTVRAPASNPDEIGMLTESFNRMLDRLQASDSQLRTANDSLNKEIAQRARVEGELLEASRLAGMAQVATGVLHNVGNVLNSVNISTQVLRNTLSTHPHLALLDQTTGLLREQGDGLLRFVAEDPRGRLVPRLILELGTQISAMRTDLLREATQLTENVEHIKQIIAMQQNYAKAGGVIQRVHPAELIAEALRIAHASVSRHGVSIVRDEVPVSELMTDRHQVLQILVNFITNSVQAVKPRPAGERAVRLALREKDGHAIISVEDNGIGIPKENLRKMFQHGFTTRKDGHGFGLHSGALAARNLGGRITAHSDGPGQGARFALELPVARTADLATVS